MSDAVSPPSAADLRPLLEDQGLALDELRPLQSGGPSGTRVQMIEGPPSTGTLRALLEQVAAELGEEDALLLRFPSEAPDEWLAAWRNGLWPVLHATTAYRAKDGRLERQTAGGRQRLDVAFDGDGRVLVLRRRAYAMSPRATVAKFDQNASGWNGEPGGPGYPHFRWMRRYVATFAPIARDTRRILDFGCGAGWVGIEAARRADAPTLHAFDPSPEMVKIAEANARANGVTDFEGRTGFGEEPPFPAAGEAPYDLVLSSGVVSFSPDIERWLDGLTRAVEAGGTLVIGDIHRDARGMRGRRARKPILPTREMNAQLREDVRAGLEQRGFRHLRSAGYQLTSPVPQLMHLNETKFGGLLTYPLLWANQFCASTDRLFGSPLQNQFDSWVMHFARAK